MNIRVNMLKKGVILLTIIIIGVYMGLSMLNGIYINEFSEIYLSLWERGLNGIFLVLYLIVIFELSISNFYCDINNKFDKNIIMRIGYKKYYIQSISKILLRTFIYAFIIHVSIIIIMNIIHDFDFTIASDEFQRNYFSSNPYINLPIFVLLSSIGSAIYCVALYPFLYFIKNKYLCKFIPLLVFFSTLIISFSLTPLLQSFLINITGNIEAAKTIMCSIMPTSLIEPGCGWYSYAILDFVCGVVIYSTICVIGFIILCKYRGIYDD